MVPGDEVAQHHSPHVHPGPVHFDVDVFTWGVLVELQDDGVGVVHRRCQRLIVDHPPGGLGAVAGPGFEVATPGGFDGHQVQQHRLRLRDSAVEAGHPTASFGSPLGGEITRPHDGEAAGLGAAHLPLHRGAGVEDGTRRQRHHHQRLVARGGHQPGERRRRHPHRQQRNDQPQHPPPHGSSLSRPHQTYP